MKCKKCGNELGTHATYCPCGWTKRNNPFAGPAPSVDCAHMGCNVPAMCKVKTKTGWANLCTNHYDQHFTDEAHANLDKYGLAKLPGETNAEHVARMREFVKAGFKKIAYRNSHA